MKCPCKHRSETISEVCCNPDFCQKNKECSEALILLSDTVPDASIKGRLL